MDARTEDRVEYVALSLIRGDEHQPRQLMDEEGLKRLKDSMSALGRTTQFITVHALGDGTYRLESGARRVRAARDLGWQRIPAIVRADEDSPRDRMLGQVAENTARAALRPFELLAIVGRLRQQGATPAAMSRGAGLSRRTVYNYLSLLDHPDLVAALHGGASLRTVLAAAGERRAEPGASPSRVRPVVGGLRRAAQRLVDSWPDLPEVERQELRTLLLPLVDVAEPAVGSTPVPTTDDAVPSASPVRRKRRFGTEDRGGRLETVGPLGSGTTGSGTAGLGSGAATTSARGPSTRRRLPRAEELTLFASMHRSDAGPPAR